MCRHRPALSTPAVLFRRCQSSSISTTTPISKYYNARCAHPRDRYPAIATRYLKPSPASLGNQVKRPLGRSLWSLRPPASPSQANRLQCLCAPSMANYVEASTQTEWAGLMQKNIVRQDLCSPAPYPNTDTPPDEPLTTKEQCVDDLTSVSPAEQRGQPQTPPQLREPSQSIVSTMSTSPLLARRHNRPNFVAHIDMPSPELRASIEGLDDEVPVSPPPSALVLSPLPEANKRFAGHTPLYIGSPNDTSREVTPKRQPPGRLDINPVVPERLRSLPVHELIVEQDFCEDADTECDVEPQTQDDSPPRTPQDDIGLTGPLTLAPNPGDGTQDTILLSALDDRLSKVATEREASLARIARQQQDQAAAEEGQPLSRQGSADSRASEVPGVDGVILKKNVPLNFGAPIGTV